MKFVRLKLTKYKYISQNQSEYELKFVLRVQIEDALLK